MKKEMKRDALKRGFRVMALAILGGLTMANYSVNAFSFFHKKSNPKFPKTVEKFLKWEFFANSANQPKDRGPQNFPCEHFEVPVHLLNKKFILDVPEIIKSSLFITKKNANGKEETYLRWIINPEDTRFFHLSVGAFLAEQSYPNKRHQFFNCYKTSSRSIIVHNPENGAVFSVKVSTNKTGGTWHNKKVDEHQVLDSIYTTRLAQQVGKTINFEHLKLLPEPMGFVVKNSHQTLDQGLIVRTYEDMAAGQSYYLPGFSALHTKVGKKIAKMNGSKDPAQFWKEHYIRPLARASAELAAFHGITVTSAHSQQYLIELRPSSTNRKRLVPTGKIVVRDYSDSELFGPFFNPDQPEELELLNNYHKDPDEGDCVKKNSAQSSGS